MSTRRSDLELGMYFVGRHDAGIEPFFASVEIKAGERIVKHHVDPALIDNALDDLSSWWWQRMDADVIPPTWQGYPDTIKERGQ